MNRILLGLLLALALLAACDVGPSPAPGSTAEPGVATPTLTFNAPVGTVDPRLDSILDEVLQDAYDRHYLAADQVTVLRAEQATWADTSLGCAEPGAGYIDVITDGFWIVLDANAIQLDYRVDSDGSFRLCTIPSRDRHPPVG